jgi:POT family proton-dependent oligopeptide transporter
MSSSKSAAKFPPQIKYIVGNEAAERFSFYGMKAILVVFMTNYLQVAANEAKASYHFFTTACYFLPLLGAFLSDRFFGKYKTIIWLSLFYCAGHAVLAIFEGSVTGMYWGLGLIALGAGGIKPCVSAHVGDQFNDKNKSLLDRVYSYFYFSINFGAFFSTLLTPWLLTRYGAAIAFGIPGVLMAIATFVFWMGRKYYVHVPPTGGNEAGFMPIAVYSLLNFGKKKSGQALFDVARAKYKTEEVDAAKAALSIFKVFATVTVFWALFDQTGGSWTLQAEKMDLNFLGMKMEAAQVQAANPIMVMALIPVFTFGLYPWVEKMGYKVTALRKMSVGMLLAGSSFVMVGMIEKGLEAGIKVNIGWQILAYLVLTMSEVMVSITGLEFAYTQAPRSMKSTIMSFWLLTVAFGNMLAGVIAEVNVFAGQGSKEFFFYAGLMLVTSVVFVWSAARYKVRDFIENLRPGALPEGA